MGGYKECIKCCRGIEMFDLNNVQKGMINNTF